MAEHNSVVKHGYVDMPFANRTIAGRLLADALSKKYSDQPNVVIYALPRGGVAVGFEVAQKLHAPLDLVITRKIGHPFMDEYAVCAVAEENGLMCDEAERGQLDPAWLAQEVAKAEKEIRRRRELYLKDMKHILPTGNIAIIVDDGIATGLTVRSAVQSIRVAQPKELIVAVPVAPHEEAEVLRKEVDALVVLQEDEQYLGAVGAYYEDFPQVSDEEVIRLLADSIS